MSKIGHRLQQAASPSSPSGPNLLVGKLFTSTVPDSTYQVGYPIANITDQNEGTRWISSPDSPAVLTTDLDGIYTLSLLRIVWAGDTIRNYLVEMSTNGTHWSTIITGATDGTSAKLAINYSDFATTPKGRYLRITAIDRWNTEWGNSLWEVAAYGTLDSSTPTYAMPVGGPTAIAWNAPVFEDNFNGTALDTSRWAPTWFQGGTQNNVVTSASNVSVSGGYLRLTLASATSGASINTAPNDVSPNPFTFTYGYAEARIYFPGNGTSIYNWPAWWTVGLAWPGNGENDIAEGLGTMTVNYHGSGVNTGDTIPGVWSNAFHTYGLYRQPGWCDIYYDGVWVKGYATNDNGAPHSLIFNIGSGYGPARYGSDYQMLVDYVRVWTAP